MAKFDLKKAILENKATFHSSLKEDMGLTPLQQYIYDFESDVSGEDFANEEIDNIKDLNNLDDVEKYYAEYRGWEDDKSLNQMLRGLVKDLAKKFPDLSENKSPLNEGQFSWFTQDTNQQIGSEDENTLPFVYMHDNKGNKWLEKRYEGYGVFGGKDYYELLDQMNGGSGDRSEGIRLAFDDAAVAAGKVLFPALTVSATLPRFHDFTEESPNDPNQSWYTPEDDDDDYIMGDRDDEYLDESKIEEKMLDIAKDMTTQETSGHAERFAKYMSNKEGNEFTVTAGSVEGPSFDLDVDGMEYEGGSYVILTNGDILNMALPGNPVYANISMLNEAEKPKTKMKKSELKAKLKEMVLAEMALDIDNMEDAPESEVDFLAEVDAILAEADEFETAKPARIAKFLKALDLLVYDEYHAELYDSDEVKQAYDLLVKSAKKLGNLNEAEDEVAVDDTEVSTDTPEGDIETTDVTTTAEVDPNVKAVQDALTQAQAAAQQLGDAKLTDQIGNTITFFTRSHVVDKGAVAEADEMEEGKKEYYDAAESDDAAHINALEKDMEDDKESSMKIKEVVFPMWQRIK
jgi:hypothetical protein